MSNVNDSTEVEPRPDSKMVLLKFPVPLLQEADALSRFNCIDRSEFITFALTQLLDYMDRKIGVRATPLDTSSPVANYELEDEAVLEAAETSDE